MLIPQAFILTAMIAAEPPRAPVLVELFTSEGCSSCPPADLLLQRLQREQPVPGAQVIPLGEHVDYWNQLGWKDPFSAAGFTDRQQQYAEVLRGEGVYTPQMIVDGQVVFVGSDTERALHAIAEAAKSPKSSVSLRCAANPPELEIRIDNIRADAAVMLALTETGLQSNVTRGENRGKLMSHTAVTRRLIEIGRARKGQPFVAAPKIAIDPGWKTESLSAVVFLQDRATHRVTGASQIPISSCAASH